MCFGAGQRQGNGQTPLNTAKGSAGPLRKALCMRMLIWPRITTAFQTQVGGVSIFRTVFNREPTVFVLQIKYQVEWLCRPLARYDMHVPSSQHIDVKELAGDLGG